MIYGKAEKRRSILIKQRFEVHKVKIQLPSETVHDHLSNVYRAFARDVIAAMLVFNFKVPMLNRANN